jgi:hypothetical protein
LIESFGLEGGKVGSVNVVVDLLNASSDDDDKDDDDGDNKDYDD